MKKLLLIMLLLACRLSLFASKEAPSSPGTEGEISGSNSEGEPEKPEEPQIPDMPKEEHRFSDEWSYDESGHWHDDICGHIGQVFGDRAAHSWHATTIQEATCTEDGLQKVVCTVCGCRTLNQVIPASHTLITHEGKQPTCREPGWQEYLTCAYCDYSTYQPLAGGHAPGDWEIKQAATCAVAGERVRRCTTCGEELESESYTAPHALVVHPGKEPTCTAPGWYKYETCEHCSYSNYGTIPALTHDIVQHEGKAPTTTAIGWQPYETCSRCSYSTYVELPVITVQHVLITHAA